MTFGVILPVLSFVHTEKEETSMKCTDVRDLAGVHPRFLLSITDSVPCMVGLCLASLLLAPMLMVFGAVYPLIVR